jgi:hypothetical protein
MDREKALGDDVAGLLDARHDPATERFDAELAAAEAEGRIDHRTSRLLRWWQRESMRALVDHARMTIPAAVAALEAARESAEQSAGQSAQAWSHAADPAPAGPATIDLEARRRSFVTGLSQSLEAE